MISKDKTYRTRDGREVRIYATDGNPDWPIHGAVLAPHGWSAEMWNASGKASGGSSQRDLIEVKPRIRRTVWVNVYEHGGVYAVTDPINKGEQCIACVKVEIDCEEGEGL